MKTNSEFIMNRILGVIAVIASIMAVVELALAHFSIRMTRLSAEEITGIFLFAFIISGLVTVFAVTRMKDSIGGKLFAVVMNFITSAAAAKYLSLLFSDEIFFKNLYYSLNRQTQMYELLSLKGRIVASIPLAAVIAGAAVFLLCGFAVLIITFAAIVTGRHGKNPGE
jgi:hypothetical protein